MALVYLAKGGLFMKFKLSDLQGISKAKPLLLHTFDTLGFVEYFSQSVKDFAVKTLPDILDAIFVEAPSSDGITHFDNLLCYKDVWDKCIKGDNKVNGKYTRLVFTFTLALKFYTHAFGTFYVIFPLTILYSEDTNKYKMFIGNITDAKVACEDKIIVVETDAVVGKYINELWKPIILQYPVVDLVETNLGSLRQDVLNLLPVGSANIKAFKIILGLQSLKADAQPYTDGNTVIDTYFEKLKKYYNSYVPRCSTSSILSSSSALASKWVSTNLNDKMFKPFNDAQIDLSKAVITVEGKLIKDLALTISMDKKAKVSLPIGKYIDPDFDSVDMSCRPEFTKVKSLRNYPGELYTFQPYVRYGVTTSAKTLKFQYPDKKYGWYGVFKETRNALKSYAVDGSYGFIPPSVYMPITIEVYTSLFDKVFKEEFPHKLTEFIQSQFEDGKLIKVAFKENKKAVDDFINEILSSGFRGAVANGVVRGTKARENVILSPKPGNLIFK